VRSAIGVKCRGRFLELGLAQGVRGMRPIGANWRHKISNLVGMPERDRIIEMDRRTARDEPLRKVACDF
jgi:hypothetical protein